MYINICVCVCVCVHVRAWVRACVYHLCDDAVNAMLASERIFALLHNLQGPSLCGKEERGGKRERGGKEREERERRGGKEREEKDKEERG